MKVKVRRGVRSDAKAFLGLVLALARFERLRPPTPAGRRRLVDDVFVKQRLNLLVAEVGHRLVGYALYFFSYSSFEARPTLYLEDLFVLEEERGKGAGLSLLEACLNAAVEGECGRMEWSVLTWNRNAIDFYEKLGARRMSDWYLYRLDRKGIRLLKKKLSPLPK